MRFVSTPEVLERFVTIEREIMQIESSIQANELSNTAVVTDKEGLRQEYIDSQISLNILEVVGFLFSMDVCIRLTLFTDSLTWMLI